MVIPWYQNSMRRLRLTGPSVCWSLGTWISYINNKADNPMSWYISLPPIVVQNHTHFSFCLYQCSRIAKCIRAERFIKCVWMNSCLGFWLFGFGLVIVFTHILTPPTNTPPPVLPPVSHPRVAETQYIRYVWVVGGLWRERRGRNQLPTTGGQQTGNSERPCVDGLSRVIGYSVHLVCWT